MNIHDGGGGISRVGVGGGGGLRVGWERRGREGGAIPGKVLVSPQEVDG